MGIPYASNYAIKKALGKYFIRVDSDDFINKHTINSMFEILEFNEKYNFHSAVVLVRSKRMIFCYAIGILKENR